MDSADLQVLEAACAWFDQGRRVLLATVLRTFGSSPRPPGAWLALADNGLLYVDVPDVMQFGRTADAPFQEFSIEHVNYFSAKSLSNLMRAHGFVPLVVQPNVEEMLNERSEKLLRVRVSCLASTAQLDIGFEGIQPESGVDPLDDRQSRAKDALSLAVCRSLIRSLKGDLRLTGDAGGGMRFEVELPLAQSCSDVAQVSGIAPERPASPLTALILQPDPTSRQALVSLLGEIGHRSVAAANVDEALDLVKRIRFHALFCSAHLPGPAWPECFEGSRGRVGAFVLLTRGHDPTSRSTTASTSSTGPSTSATPTTPTRRSTPHSATPRNW